MPHGYSVLKRVGKLHVALCAQVLLPFMLRRTKAEVETDLPAKMERVVKCPMSAWQVG